MSRGGPDVLCATVEDTLRINIDGWAYVNFYHMAEIIDAVGGVYCDVSSSELNSEGGLNWNLAEVNNLMGLPASQDAVTNTGYIWLNGRQAVAYARIRKVDSDYKRSERQVEVLRSLMDQFMSLSAIGKASAMDDILSAITTNISQEQIENYATQFLPSLPNATIEYMQLPIQGCFNSGMFGDEWSIRPNWNAMIPYVQEFFYGETTDFDPVPDISSSPALSSCPTDLDIEELLK
jgi:LCP family protein required for cell wall assembly